MPGPLLTFVDDSEADHVLIQDALDTLKLSVRSQHFVQVGAFLDALDRGEITQDAVITDLNMAGPSEFDLLQALRDRNLMRTVPVVVFSTSPSDADRDRAAALHVAGYFVKPVAYAELVERLNDILTLIRDWPGAGTRAPAPAADESPRAEA